VSRSLLTRKNTDIGCAGARGANATAAPSPRRRDARKRKRRRREDRIKYRTCLPILLEYVCENMYGHASNESSKCNLLLSLLSCHGHQRGILITHHSTRHLCVAPAGGNHLGSCPFKTPVALLTCGLWTNKRRKGRAPVSFSSHERINHEQRHHLPPRLCALTT